MSASRRRMRGHRRTRTAPQRLTDAQAAEFLSWLHRNDSGRARQWNNAPEPQPGPLSRRRRQGRPWPSGTPSTAAPPPRNRPRPAQGIPLRIVSGQEDIGADGNVAITIVRPDGSKRTVIMSRSEEPG